MRKVMKRASSTSRFSSPLLKSRRVIRNLPISYERGQTRAERHRPLLLIERLCSRHLEVNSLS